jgi:hypothetical protein
MVYYTSLTFYIFNRTLIIENRPYYDAWYRFDDYLEFNVPSVWTIVCIAE